MAKSKQRLKRKKSAVATAAVPREDSGDSGSTRSADAPGGCLADLPRWAVGCRCLAAALLGGLVVYVAYFPSDSILVESGDALWFSAIALLLWTMTMATQPIFQGSNGKRRSSISGLWGDGLPIDLIVWGLAIWMMLAALATCPPGNLRQATNEAWLWIAGAAVLSAGRRLLTGPASRSMVISLLAAVATGLAIHALHQAWISLPRTRAEYLADPDAVLRAAGINAPRNSSQRMVFANRLLDGGPTATFALANSLAAFLTVAVLVPIGLLRSWRSFKRPLWVQTCLVVLAIVGASALLATRSRSALVACSLGIAWIWLRRMPSPFSSPATDQRGQVASGSGRSKRWLAATMIASGMGGLVFLGLLWFGNDEWISAAPASLEFRLQYWKSTIAMLVDHPLMGAGPGGFQAMYLRYRLPVASETIADPHNFFFETLAAGGVIAGFLLILLIAACFRAGQKTRRETVAHDVADDSPAADHDPNSIAPWIGYGAGVSLSLIWLFASISGRLPDFEASIFAVPISIAAGWFIHSELQQRANRGTAPWESRLIGSAILIAVMTHLMFSGGWTVPGVAVVVWLVAGSICGVQEVRSSQSDRRVNDAADSGDQGHRLATKWGLAVFFVGAALLLCLRIESIVPVQEAGLALLRAEDAARRGSLQQVDRESLRAIEADRWGFEAARWRSEFLKGRLVAEGDDLTTRESWGEALETATDRAGDNPLLWRAAAEQSLHLYQRYGRSDDLQESARLISQALNRHPTDASLTAQAALIALELSDTEKAIELAAEATRLSKLGGNIVRDLRLKQAYVVEKIGAAASRRPIQRSISDQFRSRLPPDHEPVDSPERSNGTVKSVKLVE